MIHCLMCGRPMRWTSIWQEWEHIEGGSLNCDGKASVATPDVDRAREDCEWCGGSGRLQGSTCLHGLGPVRDD